MNTTPIHQLPTPEEFIARLIRRRAAGACKTTIPDEYLAPELSNIISNIPEATMLIHAPAPPTVAMIETQPKLVEEWVFAVIQDAHRIALSYLLDLIERIRKSPHYHPEERVLRLHPEIANQPPDQS